MTTPNTTTTPATVTAAAIPLPTIELTKITKSEGSLSKRITLTADGKLDPSAKDCWLSKGTAERVSISGPQQLASFIAGLKPNEAITLGAQRDDLDSTNEITPKGQLRGRKGVIARSGDYIDYRPAMPALGLLDCDIKGLPAELRDRVADAGGIVPALKSVLPALASAAMIVRESTSSNVLNIETGDEYPGSGGLHVYIYVTDGSDVQRFLKAFQQRLMLAGLGYVTVSTDGKFLERSLIDTAVGTGERLVFEGAPTLDHLDLGQRPRVPTVSDGGVLDTITACPDLSKAEMARYREFVASEEARLAPHAAAARAAWAEGKIKALVKQTGCSERVARKTVEAMSGKGLGSMAVLEFASPSLGDVTCAAVRENPELYIGESLADPIEGRPYGICAKLFRNKDGELCVHSFAHGGAVYWLRADAVDEPGFEPEERPLDDPEEDEATRLAKLPPMVESMAPNDCAKAFLQRQYTHDGMPTLYHHRGAFHGWNGRCYQKISNDGMRHHVYAFLEQARLRTGDGVSLIKPKAEMVSNVIDAVKAACYLDEGHEEPSWPGSSKPVPADDVLVCNNGLLHMSTRELHPHTPEFFAHNALPYDYSASAPEPKNWLNLLKMWWPDDTECINTLQEMFGLYLTTDTSFQKIFMIIGKKRSGKGTIIRVLTELLGSPAIVTPTLQSLTTNFGKAPLIGKKAAIITDARLDAHANQSVLAETFLTISGEDAVTVDIKYRDAWYGRLKTRILIVSNEVPRFKDASGALAGRFITMTMPRTFYGQEDASIEKAVIESELPGVLNWALDGLHRLRSRAGGFVTPDSSYEVAQMLQGMASPISEFAEERCVLGSEHKIRTDDLYAAWRSWCRGVGREKPGTSELFGKELHAALSITKSRLRGEKDRKYYYVGIGLDPDYDGLATEDQEAQTA